MKIRDFRKLGAANRDWLCAPCKDQKERAEYRGEYRSIPSSSEDEEQESPLQSEEITPHSPQTPSTPVYGLSQRGKTFMLTPATIPTPLTPTSQRRKLPIPPTKNTPRDWDDSLGHLSPPSGGGRRGRLSQADTIYHKNTIITLLSHATAYSDDAESKIADAEEEATDVIPPQQRSSSPTTDPVEDAEEIMPEKPIPETTTNATTNAVASESLSAPVQDCNEVDEDTPAPIPQGAEQPIEEPEADMITAEMHTAPDLDIDDQCPTPYIPEATIHPRLSQDSEEVVWGGIPYKELASKIDNIYNEMALFQKNLFKLPSGKAGKEFVSELAFWLRQFNKTTKLNGIAMKTLMILPTILLQKPSAKSKAKQHSESLNSRILLWRSGKIDDIMREIKHIQKSLKKRSASQKQTENLSKRFSKFMKEGNVSAALKLLDSSSSTGLLPLTDEVMEELKKKHPEPAPVNPETLLHGPLHPVPNCFFDSIDEQSILKAAKDTKGAGGPSGMDANQYRRVICSKNFQKEGKCFREELADFARKIATTLYDPLLLEAYIACRLIPLDKDPGIRPIGIGEVVRRIVGKTISRIASDYIKEAAGPLQTCAGHGAGAEAAIHAMRQIFREEGTDGVLLIDASNAFNCLNRAVALHNIQVSCPIIARYLINTYRRPACLFVAGGKKIFSMEGTTQGDPLAMAWYSLSTGVIIDTLRERIAKIKQVWLADDASGAGKIADLKDWYDTLIKEGSKFGYYVNQSKSWMIVKSNQLKEEALKSFGDSINITAEGQRHLGAVIGSEQHRKKYCQQKVDKWKAELQTLCDVAETHPQMAYSAYTKGYRSKFTFFMRTIEGMEESLSQVDELITHKFIPTLLGTDIPNPEFREILSLNASDGGIGIPELAKEAKEQHKASTMVTQPHVGSIAEQETLMRQTCPDGNTQEELLKINRAQKLARKKQEIKEIDAKLSAESKPFIEQARDKGASSWLNALPIEELNFVLNKEEFRDALRLRYNIQLDNMPSTCACGQKFDVNHALTCKKGGFITERHDNIKNLFTGLLSRVCKDVESEPHLIPITQESFPLKTTNTADDARLDIKAKSFWQRGQTAFFDVRVTHVNAKAQQNSDTKKIFRQHEQSKKREYMARVLQVENGSFTPLVFGTNGGLGEECQKFVQALSNKLSAKNGESYAQTTTWMRTRLSFEILRAAIACVRGSRAPFRNNTEEEWRDFDLKNVQGDITSRD